MLDKSSYVPITEEIDFVDCDQHTKTKQTEILLQHPISGFFIVQGKGGFLYLPFQKPKLPFASIVRYQIMDLVLSIDCCWTEEMD